MENITFNKQINLFLEKQTKETLDMCMHEGFLEHKKNASFLH